MCVIPSKLPHMSWITLTDKKNYLYEFPFRFFFSLLLHTICCNLIRFNCKIFDFIVQPMKPLDGHVAFEWLRRRLNEIKDERGKESTGNHSFYAICLNVLSINALKLCILTNCKKERKNWSISFFMNRTYLFTTSQCNYCN